MESSASRSFTAEICGTDDDANSQREEVEALLAVYPDLVEIIRRAPESAGDPCAQLCIKMPLVQGLSISVHSPKASLLRRLQEQLRLSVSFTSGYPRFSCPLVQLVTGNLTMFELDSWTKQSLLDLLRKTVEESRLGEPCVFDCIQTYIDWYDSTTTCGLLGVIHTKSHMELYIPSLTSVLAPHGQVWDAYGRNPDVSEPRLPECV